MHPGLIGSIAASAGNVGSQVDDVNPLIYGQDLRFWYNAANNLTGSGASLDWLGTARNSATRIVVAAVVFETSSGQTLTGLNYGGVAMVQPTNGSISVTSGGFTNTIEIFVLFDTSLVNIDSQVFEPTFSGGTPANVTIAAAVYGNASGTVADVERATSTTANVEATVQNQGTQSSAFAFWVAVANNPVARTVWANADSQIDQPLTSGSQSHITVADVQVDGTTLTDVQFDFEGATFQRSAYVSAVIQSGGTQVQRITDWELVSPGDEFNIESRAALEPDATDAQFPVLAATQINNLPAIQFGVGTATTLDQRLQSDSQEFDNLWTSKPGLKSLGFVAQIDSVSHLPANGAINLVVKNQRGTNEPGWVLMVNENGDLLFFLRSVQGDLWGVSFPTRYADGDLVFGTFFWDGIRNTTSPNCTARVLIGEEFVTLNPRPFGNTNGTFDDSRDTDSVRQPIVVGNRTVANNFNQSWSGYIADLWFTEPARDTIDEQYLARYLV